MTATNSSTASRGNNHADFGIGACALIQVASSSRRWWSDANSRSPSGSRVANVKSAPLAFQSADELSSGFDGAETSEIGVTSSVETHKLLRLMRHCEQPLAEGDRNRGVIRTMHDQERHGDALDALIGSERILEQITPRQKRNS